jgi:hypothetical protein
MGRKSRAKRERPGEPEVRIQAGLASGTGSVQPESEQIPETGTEL